MNSKSKKWLIIASILLVCVLAVQCLFAAGVFPLKPKEADTDPAEDLVFESLHRDGYELEQVVIFSRHNIRSPMSGKGSVLETITPHEWFPWSSNASELSLRGGILETEMGQYFRKWLESEGLFPENYHPDEGAVRIYANSKQRTIATADYFVSGLLPTANMPIEVRGEYDKMDPVFNPCLTYVSPEYSEDAKAQIMEKFGDDIKGLSDNLELLADVIDMKESSGWKDGTVKAFDPEDLELNFELGKEPSAKGSLKTGCSVSDAMVLQYFEEADPVKAAFGKELTPEQWLSISEIKDVYGDVLFGAPIVACNVAHPLLMEIESELKTEGREFTFLCGHDSNVTSVLASLGVDEYELPGAIEKTPIGCKIIFCKWKAPDGCKYISVDLVYQTVEQLKGMPLLDLENIPGNTALSFSAIKANEDGLYAEKDFMDLLRKSIDEYDRIIDVYEMEDAA